MTDDLNDAVRRGRRVLTGIMAGGTPAIYWLATAVQYAGGWGRSETAFVVRLVVSLSGAVVLQVMASERLAAIRNLSKSDREAFDRTVTSRAVWFYFAVFFVTLLFESDWN